jgi:uncharacterized Ntn-hydrolase superfamily protein
MSTVRAKEAFSYDANGYSHNVAAGDLYDSEDPSVKKRAHLFEPVEVAAARRAEALETASAAPGERRTRSAPHKQAAAAKAHAKSDDSDKSDEKGDE